MTIHRHWILDGRCEIDYDADVPCVAMEWQGYISSPEFRDANALILNRLRETGAGKLLGDIQNFTLIGADDQAWLNQVWIPRAMSVGLRACALVQPVYYFNRVAVENVARNLDATRLAVGFFGDVDAARAWLKAA